MIAAVFPGQGSQKPGMGKELFASFPTSRQVFDRVQDELGLDVAGICFESDEETLRRTENAQIALYACGLAALSAFQGASSLTFEATAGHSVGEYAALAAAGVVSLEDGARLVRKRGEIMARSGNLREGAMSAVLGLERTALDAVCLEASKPNEVVVIANDNCPGQLVISGDRAAVERAEELAKQAGAKRALRLNVSGAFHSPLMADSAKEMGNALDPSLFHKERAAVYANVSSEKVDNAAEWCVLLEKQLQGTVRWTETVEHMSAAGIRTFIEFGAGEVLCGLIKRIDKEAETYAVYDSASLDKCLVGLSERGAAV